MDKALTVNEPHEMVCVDPLIVLPHHVGDHRGWITMTSDAYPMIYCMPERDLENIEILCHEFIENTIWEILRRDFRKKNFRIGSLPVPHMAASLCHGSYVGFKIFYNPDRMLQRYNRLLRCKRSPRL